MTKNQTERPDQHRPQRSSASRGSLAQRHFQAIILGDSLGSRIAGVILAKRGCRILTLRGEKPAEHSWLQSSIHLEQLLESLGGRACFSPPIPFQVLSDECRLEINGTTPLEEELRREFPLRHQQVFAVLEKLGELGEELEKVLWNSGGLPLFGIGSRLKFTSRCLFSGLAGKGMMRPISDLLASFAGDPAGTVLNALFTGLSMVPPEKLTVAEGALLWSNATRNRNVSPSGLDDLLRHRYEQFHGETEDLGELQSLEFKGNTVIGATLSNGARCSADHFLLGSPEGLSFLPEKLRSKIPPVPPGASQLTASLTGTRISSLIAPRVILAGEPALRLTLTARENQIQCAVDFPLHPLPVDGGEIERRLSKEIFPFARFTLENDPTPRATGSVPGRRKIKERRFLGAAAKMGLPGNLFLSHGPGILPSLAATGEVLAGFSAASQIQRRIKLAK